MDAVITNQLEPLGVVQQVSGKLIAKQPDGSGRVLLAGDPVYQGDILIAESGSAQLGFTNGSITEIVSGYPLDVGNTAILNNIDSLPSPTAGVETIEDIQNLPPTEAIPGPAPAAGGIQNSGFGQGANTEFGSDEVVIQFGFDTSREVAQVPVQVNETSATAGFEQLPEGASDIVIPVAANDYAPTDITGSLRVSEQGLLAGTPVGSSGFITFIDLDETVPSPTANWDLDTIQQMLDVYSGGLEVRWSLDSSNSSILLGEVDTGNGTEAVLTATLGNISPGEAVTQFRVGYSVELLQPLDHPENSAEDFQFLNFTVVVSDGFNVSDGIARVTVEDDMPVVSETTDEAEPSAVTGLNATINLTTSNASGGQFVETHGTTISAKDYDGGDNANFFIRNGGTGVRSDNGGAGEGHHGRFKEVNFRVDADGSTHSEAIIIDLNGQVANGMVLNLSAFYTKEGERGKVIFYRNGQEVGFQEFALTNVAFNTGETGGLFDKVEIQAANNGNGVGQDNSDFNVRSVTFTADIAIGSTSGQLNAEYGADGSDSISLNGIQSESIALADGRAVTLRVSENGSQLIGIYDENGLEKQAFVLTVNSDGAYEFVQYKTLNGEEGDLQFSYVISDNDGDTLDAALTISPVTNVLVGSHGDDVINGSGGNDLIAGGLGDDTLQGHDGVDTFRYSLADLVDNDLLLTGGNYQQSDSIKDFVLTENNQAGDILDLQELLATDTEISIDALQALLDISLTPESTTISYTHQPNPGTDAFTLNIKLENIGQSDWDSQNGSVTETDVLTQLINNGQLLV